MKGQPCRYEGEAEDLGLTFSVEDDVFGKRHVHELCPGGDDMAVTSANKLLYVHLVADWHLNRRLGKPASSFAAGLHQADIPSCTDSIMPLSSGMSLLVIPGRDFHVSPWRG